MTYRLRQHRTRGQRRLSRRPCDNSANPTFSERTAPIPSIVLGSPNGPGPKLESRWITTPARKPTSFLRISVDQLQPGDLVFFNVDLGHMGMYIGNDQIIQAPRTGDVVKITTLNRGNVVVAVRPG